VTDQEFSVALRAFSRRQPFQSFLVEFVSGRQIQIKHPGGVAAFARVWLVHEAHGARVVFSSSSVCRLLDGPPVAPLAGSEET
jgi:hypothetical protein